MSKTIIISPYSRKLKNNNLNPKDYPYFPEVIKKLRLKDYYIIQIGIDGESKFEEANEYQFNLSFKELENLTNNVYTFIAIDNFYPHFAYLLNKKGIVIFSQSDPQIFGHDIHINLLKNKKYLRKNQYDIWETTIYNNDSFIEPQIVINTLLNFT